MKLNAVLIILAGFFLVSCSPNTSSKPEAPLTPITPTSPTTTETNPEVAGKQGPSVLVGRPVDAATMGDWDSFGDPVMPPEPIEISGTYECSAFLQDQIRRSGKVCENCEDYDYRLYRLYTFEVSESKKEFNFENIGYQKIAYFGLYADLEHPQLEVEEDLKLETPQIELRFNLIQDYSQENAPLVLNVNSKVGQGFADKIVYKYENHQLSPEYGGSFNASISARNKDEANKADVPQLLLDVQCSKN